MAQSGTTPFCNKVPEASLQQSPSSTKLCGMWTKNLPSSEDLSFTLLSLDLDFRTLQQIGVRFVIPGRSGYPVEEFYPLFLDKTQTYHIEEHKPVTRYNRLQWIACRLSVAVQNRSRVWIFDQSDWEYVTNQMAAILLTWAATWRWRFSVSHNHTILHRRSNTKRAFRHPWSWVEVRANALKYMYHRLCFTCKQNVINNVIGWIQITGFGTQQNPTFWIRTGTNLIQICTQKCNRTFWQRVWYWTVNRIRISSAALYQFYKNSP